MDKCQLKELIKSIVDEMSTNTGVDGYNSKFAFSRRNLDTNSVLDSLVGWKKTKKNPIKEREDVANSLELVKCMNSYIKEYKGYIGKVLRFYYNLDKSKNTKWQSDRKSIILNNTIKINGKPLAKIEIHPDSEDAGAQYINPTRKNLPGKIEIFDTNLKKFIDEFDELQTKYHKFLASKVPVSKEKLKRETLEYLKRVDSEFNLNKVKKDFLHELQHAYQYFTTGKKRFSGYVDPEEDFSAYANHQTETDASFMSLISIIPIKKHSSFKSYLEAFKKEYSANWKNLNTKSQERLIKRLYDFYSKTK